MGIERRWEPHPTQDKMNIECLSHLFFIDAVRENAIIIIMDQNHKRAT